MNSFLRELRRILRILPDIGEMKYGILFCFFAFAVIVLMYINPVGGILAQWPMLVFAGGFIVIGVALMLFAALSPNVSVGFQRLADHIWRDFFNRVYENHDSDSGILHIDMVAHNLWAHFKPKGWDTNRPLDEFIPAIEQLEFDAHLWSGLRTLVREVEVQLRVMIIKPQGHQSELVAHQQRRANESGRDRGRQANEDGIRTLFVVRKLVSHHARLTATVRVLKEGDLTMTYSLCRVGNAVLVGHYPFDLLSKNAPCSEFDRTNDHDGRSFWNHIDDFFTSEKQHDHSVALILEQAPGSYAEFKEWVLDKIG